MHEPSAVNPDVARIQRIDAIPRILSAVARITGMRFCAVARVTDTCWTACAVLDELGFGLAAGDELELETTLCNEVRQHHVPVAFNQASTHPVYSQHHTPRIYGLESYVSVPIFRRNGGFFGTLCAIDSRPADVDNPTAVGSLQLFAEMIGLQLELLDDLDAARARLRDADFRQELITGAERDIRNIFQPIVTSLYLLRTSPTLSGEDRVLVDQMEACSLQLTDLLHRQLDVTVERIEERLADVRS